MLECINQKVLNSGSRKTRRLYRTQWYYRRKWWELFLFRYSVIQTFRNMDLESQFSFEGYKDLLKLHMESVSNQKKGFGLSSEFLRKCWDVSLQKIRYKSQDTKTYHDPSSLEQKCRGKRNGIIGWKMKNKPSKPPVLFEL